jgi:hypothetical protein
MVWGRVFCFAKTSRQGVIAASIVEWEAGPFGEGRWRLQMRCAPQTTLPPALCLAQRTSGLLGS